MSVFKLEIAFEFTPILVVWPDTIALRSDNWVVFAEVLVVLVVIFEVLFETSVASAEKSVWFLNISVVL